MNFLNNSAEFFKKRILHLIKTNDVLIHCKTLKDIETCGRFMYLFFSKKIPKFDQKDINDAKNGIYIHIIDGGLDYNIDYIVKPITLISLPSNHQNFNSNKFIEKCVELNYELKTILEYND